MRAKPLKPLDCASNVRQSLTMPNKRPKPSRTRLSIQVPADLRAAIERAAAADRRTVSSWVVCALADAVKGGK